MRFPGFVAACLVLVCCISSAHADFFWKKKKNTGEAASTALPVTPIPPAQTETAAPSTAAQAEPPKVPKDKKALYRLKDDETVEALVKLAGARQFREQELIVVGRLLNEKQLELTGFNEQLKEKFGISEEGNYQYDDVTRTIFELKAKPGAEKAPKGANPDDLVERIVQRELENQEAEKLFLQMVGAKKVTTDEIRALQLILQEKKIELSNIQESLQQQFSMDPEKHYEYDVETRVVYELIVAVSDGKVVAAEKK